MAIAHHASKALGHAGASRPETPEDADLDFLLIFLAAGGGRDKRMGVCPDVLFFFFKIVYEKVEAVYYITHYFFNKGE